MTDIEKLKHYKPVIDKTIAENIEINQIFTTEVLSIILLVLGLLFLIVSSIVASREATRLSLIRQREQEGRESMDRWAIQREQEINAERQEAEMRVYLDRMRSQERAGRINTSEHANNRRIIFPTENEMLGNESFMWVRNMTERLARDTGPRGSRQYVKSETVESLLINIFQELSRNDISYDMSIQNGFRIRVQESSGISKPVPFKKREYYE